MTPTEINIAIAEVCGWKLKRQYQGEPHGIGVWINQRGSEVNFTGIPDYYHDLNACAEMERSLETENDKRLYVDYLVTLMKPGEFTVMATAPQRCEAFLRVKGLWKGGERNAGV